MSGSLLGISSGMPQRSFLTALALSLNIKIGGSLWSALALTPLSFD